MKKRVLSLLMAVAMLVSVLPVMSASAAKGQKFSDVYRGKWFAKYVYPVSEAGIINGDGKGKFNPGSKLKRCDVITMLALSAKTPEELKEYEDMELCPDSKQGQWYTKSVNWAAQEGIIPAGENFRPKDDITRMETVELVYSMHKAHHEVVPLTPVRDPLTFPDTGGLSSEQKEALDACTSGNVIDGTGSGAFDPSGLLQRDQASRIICDMLELETWEDSKIPEKPKPQFVAPTTGYKNGATYVEFDPQFFNGKIALANGRLDSAASYSSILSGQNAYIAVNGAMFNHLNGANTTYGSFVSNGKVLRIMRPDTAGVKREAAFVIDSNGKASIQWMNINQKIDRVDSGTKAIESVGLNTTVGNNDGSRMVYTSEFASKVSGKVAYAFAVDSSNTITKVYTSASDVPVPKGGYVLFTRIARDPWTDRFFTLAKAGDKLERTFEYAGSTVQNVQTLISCGPTVLKKGAIFTNYASEGNYDDHVLGSGTHMLLGVKADGKAVIAYASGSQQSMGNIMKSLGCTSAITVDGGASTYLSCNGKTFITPGRNLTNMLVFTKK